MPTAPARVCPEHVFGRNAVKQRQIGEVEQGVLHSKV